MQRQKFKKFSGMLCTVLLSLSITACNGGSEPVPEGSVEAGMSQEESREADSSLETQTTEGQEESSLAETQTAESQEESASEEPAKETTAQDADKEEEGYTIAHFDLPEGEVFDMLYDMKIGWNLGNTFDAIDCNWLSNELDYESAWCGAKTTTALIDELKEAGFNTIRIPVSWHNHVSSREEGYVISEAWLNRVTEVVDYCLSKDMYVIINIHHDNNVNYLYPSTPYLEQSKDYITCIWTQLSEHFKDYDHKLLFEGMNEPRLVGHNNEWWIDPNNADCIDAISCINELNQTFVDTVRASGGNNASRYLLCPGYCASPDGVLNKGFVFPTDPVNNDNHIILEVHSYSPYSFALESPGTDTWSSKNGRNTGDAVSFMNDLYKKYVSNGIPVLIDEFGSQEKNGNLESRIDHAGYYIASARARGITCVWWDNNLMQGNGERFGIIDRNSLKWAFPEIVEAMMKYAQ